MSNTDNRDIYFLQDETVRLHKEYFQAVKKFFTSLSGFSSLKDYLAETDQLNTDENRAEFLCALAKFKFPENDGKEISFAALEIPNFLRPKGISSDVIKISLNFNHTEKKLIIKAEASDLWDSFEINYSFNCFCLYFGELIDGKTEGKTTLTYSRDPEPSPTQLNHRDDDEIRLIIDALFNNLKKETN
jgi:hypothetical protein